MNKSIEQERKQIQKIKDHCLKHRNFFYEISLLTESEMNNLWEVMNKRKQR